MKTILKLDTLIVMVDGMESKSIFHNKSSSNSIDK